MERLERLKLSTFGLEIQSSIQLSYSRKRQGDLFKILRNYKWYTQRDSNSYSLGS